MNWALLERDDLRVLAPSFDHGSSLASGSEDDRLARLDVALYCGRAYARSFEDGRTLPLTSLARRAITTTGGIASEWLERIEAVDGHTVGGVVEALPELSDVRRRFLTSVLLENRRRLLT